MTTTNYEMRFRGVLVRLDSKYYIRYSSGVMRPAPPHSAFIPDFTMFDEGAAITITERYVRDDDATRGSRSRGRVTYYQPRRAPMAVVYFGGTGWL